MLILKESPIILAASIASIIITRKTKFVYLTAVILLFLLYFYRYEPINTRYNDSIVLSPAEGRITHYLENDKSVFISIFMSPFNRHTQIYPMNGLVIGRRYDETGKYRIVVEQEKSKDNEKLIHYISTKYGLIEITQIAGFLPRRIVADDKISQRVNAGEYLGMIKFGSRVDLLLPKRNLNIFVKLHDTVSIGQVIARYSV